MDYSLKKNFSKKKCCFNNTKYKQFIKTPRETSASQKLLFYTGLCKTPGPADVPRSPRPARRRGIVRQRFSDLAHPAVEDLGRAGVGRGKAADDPRPGQRDYHVRSRNQEHRRADRRKRQISQKPFGQWQGDSWGLWHNVGSDAVWSPAAWFLSADNCPAIRCDLARRGRQRSLHAVGLHQHGSPGGFDGLGLDGIG